MTRRIWRIVAVLLVLVLVTMAAACGDDDDDVATDETETEGEADLAAACEEQLKVNQAFAAFFGELPERPEGEPTPEQIQQVRDAYEKHVPPAVEDFKAVAPAELEEEIAQAEAVLAKFEDDPNPDLFGSPEFVEAGNAIDGYFFERCEGQTAEVKAVDYAFEGLPEALEAGTIRIELENTGEEVHEIVILGKADGVTESFDEILALPQEEAEPKTKFVNAGFVGPGQTTYVTSEIEAGEYVAACFVPEGSVDPETEADGPPHFTLGMKTEFKVS